MSVLAPVVEQVRAVVERRGLSEAEVARMSGVDPKTIRRLLTGRTCGRETLERVCGALSVPLDIASIVEARVLARVRGQIGGQDRTGAAKSGQERSQAVCGWDQAAQVLGVSSRTLRRYRREAGDLTEVPWWSDRAALCAWFGGLVDELSDPGTDDEPASVEPQRVG